MAAFFPPNTEANMGGEEPFERDLQTIFVLSQIHGFRQRFSANRGGVTAQAGLSGWRNRVHNRTCPLAHRHVIYHGEP